MSEQERSPAEKFDDYVMPIMKGYDPFTVSRAKNTTQYDIIGERSSVEVST